MHGSCSVQVEDDLHIVLGGITGYGTQDIQIVDTVRAVNTTEDSAREIGHLKNPRAFHACEILENNLILVAGGANNIVAPESNLLNMDEAFNISGLASEDVATSINKYLLALLRLGDTVFALGGRVANGSEVNTVHTFDRSTSSWMLTDQTLQSQATADLAVAALPQSAVDCSAGCRCGTKRQDRIFNGTEAKVTYKDTHI